MRIKKGDNILVLTGKDRGKKGQVLRALPREAKVVIEGVFLQKKHVRAKKAGQKGQMAEMPAPFSISNVRLVCGKCQKPTRAGYRIEGKRKVRVCKKCGAEI